MAAILVRPLVAPVASRVAPSALLALGAGAVGVATALMTFAHSFLVVLLLRALTGIGDAFYYVLAANAVYALAPVEEQASAQSRFSAIVSAGILLGPVVAEALRPQVSYTGIWLLGAGLCAAACAWVGPLPIAREPAATHRRALLEPAAVLPGVVIAAQTWGMAAFTVFVALYANHLGLQNADAPFAIVAVIVLTVRSIGAGVFDRFRPLTIAVASMVAASSGLALLAVLPDQRALLAASALIAVSQALAFPALLHLAVQRATAAQRTAAIATFTGFFEAGLATAAIALGAVLDNFGFAGLYGVAAAVSAAALAPLMLSRVDESERCL